MTHAPLSASIIVTTRNRSGHLRRILPSLTHLTYDALEVIVVVGPSEDDTWDVVQEFRDQVKIVTSPKANMCLSRNLGLAQAAGDFVVFIDDDGIPATPTWIDALAEAFARDPKIGAAGGPVFDRDSDAYQFRNGIVSEYGEHVFTAGTADAAAIPDGWFRRSMGTNAAFRRTALLEIGGFDERIVYYGDECDVCVRLAHAGYQFAFVEEAAVRHYPAPSPHRGVLTRTRTVTHDDNYFCLRNAQAPLFTRLARTLKKAPGKHYVREAVLNWRQGRMTTADYVRFWALWTRGLTAAVRDALFASPGLMTAAVAPPPLKRLSRATPSPKRSIALMARQLACDGPVEGPARYTYDLAEGLHALGHDVHVFGESPAARRHLRLGFTVHGIAPGQIVDHVFPKHAILNGNVAYALAVGERMRQLRQSGVKIDVAHATNWNFEGLGVQLDGVVPVVMMLVTSLAEVIEYEQWSRNDDLDAGVWLDRAQVRAAAATTAPSAGLVRKYLGNSLLDAAGASAVGIAPLGIVTRRADPIECAEHRLLFVGTHVRRKGLPDLLAVLPELLTRHEGWRCDIAGDDSRVVDGDTLKNAFLRQHAGAKWLSRVTFHGRVSDAHLWRLYASASLYVVPSRFESFGLTYLEAMQFGVPVVATRAGGIPEVVSDGKTGLLVEAGDLSELHAAVDGLMADDRRRTELGEAARLDVQARWTHVHMASRLLEVYERAVTTHRPVERGDRRASEAIVELIAAAGAPVDLTARMQQSRGFEGNRAEQLMLIDAATGRLPLDSLYVQAVERSLERGEPLRAVRLADDAAQHCAHLTADASAELSELRELATQLALVDQHLSIDSLAPREAAATPSPVATTPAERMDAALALIREGRAPLGMARLFVLVEDDSLAPLARLTASYHLASALKRCGYAIEAERRLRLLVGGAGFNRLPDDVRAAAWFHAGDLALAAGRSEEADGCFTRCLELNPMHGRAATLRRDLRDALVTSRER